MLKKDNNETDPVYDYFGIEDNIEITSHNGAHSDGATIKHTFPFSSDDIYDWSPSDATNSSQLQVSIGYPSGITLSYTTNVGGRINLRDNGSQTNDIAEWVISTAAFSFDALPNPTRFKPSTTWFSTGTYASIRLTHNVSFWDTLYDYSIDQVITVSYDY